MSIHSSLKTQGNLAVTRNVLTRAERIAKLYADGSFKPGDDSPIGLRKTSAKGHVPKVDLRTGDKG
ncbi:MAG: small basic protein [Phycisphaerales bacterium]|nr:small basic protein [Phycisphaerales bacterium]